MIDTLSVWQFPLSLILSLAFLAGVYALWRYLPEGLVRSVLSGRMLGIVSMTAVLGMTAVEGTWGELLHRTPVFWMFALLMMQSLLFTVLEELKRRISLSAIVSHAGLFVLCFGAFWGAPDVECTQMIAPVGVEENLAYTREGKLMPLPFKVKLQHFDIDCYDDGVSPRQYTSTFEIEGVTYETSVNHPCYHDGYFIYQSDFDHERHAFSILKLVTDPWLPLIYAGIAMLAIGAFLRLRIDWRSRYLTVAVVLTAILFTALSVARINFGTLMPALRSWWFVPHLVFYMIAYSALALSLVLGALSLCEVRSQSFKPLASKLLNTSSSLLLLGMLCGAVWAKDAWGDWWTWDAKECWAAVTWICTLVAIHLPHKLKRRDLWLVLTVLLSFAAMQMAWYGVEHVPASKNSMHTYK